MADTHSSTFPPAYNGNYRLSIYKRNFDSSLVDIDKDTSPQIAKQRFLEHCNALPLETTAFYTDGSKTDDCSPVGASVYSPSINFWQCYKLPSSASVISSEAWALLQAVNAILDLNIRKAVIFSDSRSVLAAIAASNSRQENYLVFSIKQKLMEAESREIDILLCWVPAHKKIPGNERADRLAKLAARHGNRPPFDSPYTDLRIEARSNSSRAYKEYLEEAALTKGTQYFELFFNCSPDPWYLNKGLNRREIACVSR